MDAIRTDAIREIQLTQGYIATLIESDLVKVSSVEFSDGTRWTGRICDEPWCVCRPSGPRGKVYAMTRISPRHCVYLHRAVMDANANQQVDHVDGNGLNNCRDNLRFASNQQNNWNKPKQRLRSPTSRYKGVTFDPRRNCYYARIKIDNTQKYLGATKTEEEAAKLYDLKAIELHGEFAVLNFPEAVHAS